VSTAGLSSVSPHFSVTVSVTSFSLAFSSAVLSEAADATGEKRVAYRYVSLPHAWTLQLGSAELKRERVARPGSRIIQSRLDNADRVGGEEGREDGWALTVGADDQALSTLGGEACREIAGNAKRPRRGGTTSDVRRQGRHGRYN